MAAAANSLHRGAQSSEQGLLLFRLLLLRSVMTFVGRRIGVEGLVYPRGERERQKERDGRGGEAKTCTVGRQERGLWKYELIFFLCCGRIESSKENRLQAGWHARVVLGKCEVRGACSLFLFLSLSPLFFCPPAPPISPFSP